MRRKSTVLVLAAACGVGLAACGARGGAPLHAVSHHGPSASGTAMSSSTGVALPPGFTRTPQPQQALAVGKPPTINPAQMHPRSYQTTAAVSSEIGACANQPVPVSAHALVVSGGSLGPGTSATVLATGLPGTPQHLVEYILCGPGGQRATAQWPTTAGIEDDGKLVTPPTGTDISVAEVTLPRTMAAGQWLLAALDISALTVGANGQVAGQAVMAVAAFTVEATLVRTSAPSTLATDS